MTDVADPEAIDETFVPAARTGTAAFEHDGETLVVTDEGAVHRLNPTAAVIWTCCDGAGPLGDLIDELSEAYGVERGAIADDVLTIVRDFGRNGLLEGVEPPPKRARHTDAGEVVVRPAADEGCPEPTATEATASDDPLPRYLVVPPST